MRRVAAFWGLPGSDQLLLLKAAATITFCQLALRFVDFQRLLLWAGRLKPGAGQFDRIVWATHVAARSMPGITCLGAALALQRLLARHGYSSDLRLGVTKAGQEFGAHAWLVFDGRVLIGDGDLGKYTELGSWKACDKP